MDVQFEGQCFGTDPTRIQFAFLGPDGNPTDKVKIQGSPMIGPGGRTLKVKFIVDMFAPLSTPVTPYKVLLDVDEYPLQWPFQVIAPTVKINFFEIVPLGGVTTVTVESQALTPGQALTVELIIKSLGATAGGAVFHTDGTPVTGNGPTSKLITFQGNQQIKVKLEGVKVSSDTYDVILEAREKTSGSGDGSPGEDPLLDDNQFTVFQYIVDSVGFVGGHQLYSWEMPGNPAIVNNGVTVNWNRDKPENPNSKAAYNFQNLAKDPNQEVRVFANISVVPIDIFQALTETIPVKFRVVAQEQTGVGLCPPQDGMLSASDFITPRLVLDRTKLETSGQGVKVGRYTLVWQASYEKANGTDIWTPLSGPAGVTQSTTGPHTIYWTFTNPIANPFFDPLGTGLVKNYLFDRALEWGCGLVAGGINGEDSPGDQPVNNPVEIANRVTKGIGAKISLQLADQEELDHPLEITDDSSSSLLGGSSNHAVFLTGLLKSIGIGATTKYYWSGNQQGYYSFVYIKDPDTPDGGKQVRSFQVIRPSNDQVETNPHFIYYAVVAVNGIPGVYDPSYGNHSLFFKYAQFSFGECVDERGNFLQGANKVESTKPPGRPLGVDQSTCDHGENATIIPETLKAPVKANAEFLIKITITNTGSITLPQGSIVKLKPSESLNQSWGVPEGFDLAIPLPPKESFTSVYKLKAPSDPGIHGLQFLLFDNRQGIQSFGEGKTIEVVVRPD
ncbi:MAG: hypothetical protein HY774_25270 [Acidobacteria bacterium]|nr:hypothetical protein [Acidobacteriota bacterium]